jgi:hypothetical protein
LLERNVIQQAPPRLHLNEHVHVTTRPCVAPGYGPEKPKIGGTMCASKARYLIPMLTNGCIHSTKAG